MSLLNLPRPIITLLTDFGLKDHYVASMKGVMLEICPDAQLVDITHEIPPFAIPDGAYQLGQAWQNFPSGTVHVAVVDPGVGSSRRAIVIEAGGHLFVGPDNGIFGFILDSVPDHTITELTETQYFRHPVSKTFHGRDVFAPVAAHLANGTPPATLGTVLFDPVAGDFTRPFQSAPNEWTGRVLSTDRFGNLILNFDRQNFAWIEDLGFKLQLGSASVDRIYPNYSDTPGGELVALWGSGNYLEVSIKQGLAGNILALRGAERAVLSRYQHGSSTMMVRKPGTEPCE